jgi:hypothetical protein
MLGKPTDEEGNPCVIETKSRQTGVMLKRRFAVSNLAWQGQPKLNGVQGIRASKRALRVRNTSASGHEV